MEKKIGGLASALAGLASISAAQAAIAPGPAQQQVTQASSYRELLNPIPNAVELLRASNAELLKKAQAQLQPRVQEAQYYNEAPPPFAHHHHHHHHNAYYPPPPPPEYYHHHHHHHHHHHQGAVIVIPGIGEVSTN